MSRPEYLLQFLPPVFSIYLIVVSGLAGKLVVSRIRSFVANSADERLKEKLPLIQNLVLSGVLQVVFINSMLAAMISVLVILRKDHALAVFALLLILTPLIGFIYWTLSLNPDELSNRKFVFIPIKYAFSCKLVLIIVNIVLCFTIWWSNQP